MKSRHYRPTEGGGAYLGVLAFLAILVALAVMIGPSIFFGMVIREQVRKNPGLLLQPQPLKPAADLATSPTLITFASYTIAVPWGLPGRTQEESELTTFVFPARRMRAFAYPAYVVSFALATDAAEREELQRRLGFAPPTDAFEGMKWLMQHQPTHPHLFAGWGRASMAATLAHIKGLYVGANSTGIFILNSPGSRMIQINDPEKSKMVRLLVYNGEGALRLDVTATNGAALTQSELDFVARSVRFAYKPRPVTAPPAPAGDP